MTSSKKMLRSRNQLASAYAPESFFTFEGGLGACIAKGIPTPLASLTDSTKNQIFERLDELAHNWFSQSINCRDEVAGEPPVKAVQCLDPEFLNTSESGYVPLDASRMSLVEPSEMAYAPAPLTFMCESCKLVKTFDTVAELNETISTLSDRSKCAHPKKPKQCDWRQMDLVFVHWSGNWEPVRVNQWHWDEVNQTEVLRKTTCNCGSTDFTLDRPTSALGDAFFRCAACQTPVSKRWLQQDKQTLKWVKPSEGTIDRLSEARMQVSSYRASAVYYVQGDQFINFEGVGSDNLSLLLQGREEDLLTFIGQRVGFAGTYPPEEDVKKSVLTAGLSAEWDEYAMTRDSIPVFEAAKDLSADMKEIALGSMRSNCQKMLKDWVRRGIIKMVTEVPAKIRSNALLRKTSFATKYDPFRLSVEHATLTEGKIAPETMKGSKRLYVPFDNLDQDLSPKNPAEKATKEAETRQLIKQLGITQMGLIREFDLCKFTFGFSRMEAGPVLKDKRHLNMPVRLNLFPKVRYPEGVKNPVYVVTQANEAIYVRLDPTLVYRWLKTLKCHDMFGLEGSGQKIGAGLLMEARPMDRFLSQMPRTDKPPVYLYTYTLLHTYSHLMMRFIAEYSGLDVGSLGEYIFPTDLAFVIYRNGTTMDLGNLSAMWRNSGEAFLRSLLRPKALMCGSGGLCTNRGGACPDCLMVPESSCVASNRLISRAVLRSIGGRPHFDVRPDFQVKGYLDFVTESYANGSTSTA
jgi:hypothetical protein